jgi:CRP-like cAMP-binding protein
MEPSMKATAELIKKHLGDSGILDSTLMELAAICKRKTYKADEIIYREHDESTQLFIVNSGQVDIQYKMPKGKRETVDTCYAGDFLVWSALVKPYQTNSIGICRAKAELLAFDGAKLRALCEKDTKFGYCLMSLIAGVIRRRLHAARKEIVSR